jgi:hypothetical protein
LPAGVELLFCPGQQNPCRSHWLCRNGPQTPHNLPHPTNCSRKYAALTPLLQRRRMVSKIRPGRAPNRRSRVVWILTIFLDSCIQDTSICVRGLVCSHPKSSAKSL